MQIHKNSHTKLVTLSNVIDQFCSTNTSNDTLLGVIHKISGSTCKMGFCRFGQSNDCLLAKYDSTAKFREFCKYDL